MKVVLFYPNLYGMNMLPPAIGFFTALLKRDNHQVKLFDTTIYEGLDGSTNTDQEKVSNLNARAFDDSILKNYSKNKDDAVSDFDTLIKEFQPDLIAMSCTEDMYPIGINLLKKLTHKPKVVIGGVFPTFAPELSLKLSDGTVDYVLKGEGDRTLPLICKKLEAKESIENIDGLYMKSKNGYINNPLPIPISMEEQVLPDYSLFEESRFYRPMQGKMRRMLPVTTIRGCPYTCAYCNSPSQMQIHKDEKKTFLRNSKISTVYKEIKHLIKNYSPDSFYFWADTFLAWNNDEFDQFCDMYEEFKLPFWIQTRPETVTQYKFERLKNVGLLRVAFGLEHGNEEVREKTLNRKISNKKILEKLKIVTDLNQEKSYYDRLGECRLSIATYNGTTYLETFAQNYPTLLYLTPNHWELRDDAKIYFDILKEVGIFHDNADSLAKKIEEIYKDPLSWWQDEKIQNAKNIFCKNFADISRNLVLDYKREIGELC